MHELVITHWTREYSTTDEDVLEHEESDIEKVLVHDFYIKDSDLIFHTLDGSDHKVYISEDTDVDFNLNVS